MSSPEELARERENIDALLTRCGWTLQTRSTINFDAASGNVDREHLEANNILGPIYKAFGERLWPLMELGFTLAA